MIEDLQKEIDREGGRKPRQLDERRAIGKARHQIKKKEPCHVDRDEDHIDQEVIACSRHARINIFGIERFEYQEAGGDEHKYERGI